MRSLFIALCLFGCLDTEAQVSSRLQGSIDSCYDTYLSLSMCGASPSDTFRTTVPIIKGQFSQTLKLPHYGVYFLHLDSNYRISMYVLIDSSNLSLTMIRGDMTKTICRGSSTMMAYNKLVIMQERERKLAGKYIKAKMRQPVDTIAVKLASDTLGMEMAEKKIARLAYIKEYPSNISSAYELLNGYNLENDLDTVKILFAGLNLSARICPYGRRLQENIDNAHLFAIGNNAPDIAAKDSAGVVHSLSDYRGKYILLDYWASWCVPCRIQVPFLQKVYAEYGSKVQVISVSVDTERDKWIEAIQKDKMDWLNISDLAGINGPSAAPFKIEAVPTIYLIDPDGRILSKKLNDKGVYNAVQKAIQAEK